MKRLRGIDPVDVLAAVGVILLGLGIGLRVGFDVAIAVVGSIILIFAILLAANAARSEGAQ